MHARTLVLLLIVAFGYIVSPIDLLPDVIIGLGWLDDIAVMGLVAYLLFSYLPKHGGIRWGAERTEAETAPRAGAPDTATDPFQVRFTSSDPYTVLGVPTSAETDEIKHAYRDLLAQYHPDKVAHLSPEFQELAHERAVAIQRAYAQVGEP